MTVLARRDVCGRDSHLKFPSLQSWEAWPLYCSLQVMERPRCPVLCRTTATVVFSPSSLLPVSVHQRGRFEFRSSCSQPRRLRHFDLSLNLESDPIPVTMCLQFAEAADERYWRLLVTVSALQRRRYLVGLRGASAPSLTARHSLRPRSSPLLRVGGSVRNCMLHRARFRKSLLMTESCICFRRCRRTVCTQTKTCWRTLYGSKK